MSQKLANGSIVGWQFRQAVNLQFADVQRAMTAAGLDPSEAKELGKGNAFKRACQSMKQNRTIDKVDKSKSGITRFQLTQKALRQGKIDFEYEAILTLDTQTGRVTCDESKDLQDLAQQLLDEAVQKRNAQDVTRLLQRLFTKNAELWPILSTKGVIYFCPARHNNFTLQVEDFVVRIGGEFVRWPIDSSTPEGKRTMRKAVDEGIQALIREAADSEKEWTEATREDTIKRAHQRLERIELMISGNSDFLGDAILKLKKAAIEMKKKIVAHMQQTAEV